MSLWVLLATAGTLGLLGGLHCIAMCSALQRVAVHGTAAGAARTIPIVRADAAPHVAAGGLRADLGFHAARLAGYASLGAAVGGGSWLLRWGAEALPLMRPLWGTANALMLALGLSLLVLGRQPAWIDDAGGRAWRATGGRLSVPRARRPLIAGFAWALVPCGLLWSALATAALASDPFGGAAAMLAFGAGTAADLLAVQWVAGRIQARSAARIEATGIRVGGALLAAMAIAALVALALGQPHPFCIV